MSKKTQRLISVTKKHIREGKQGCEGECPVALAILDEYIKDYDKVEVSVFGDEIDIWLVTKNGDKRFINKKTSTRVHRWITQFDLGNNKVKPFSFYMPR